VNWAVNRLLVNRPILNRRVAENGPGVAASVLVHGLILLVLLFLVRHTTAETPDAGLRTMLVDIIHLGAETASPPAPRRSTSPSQEASVQRAATARSPLVGFAPHAPPKTDDLENRLNQLAKLRAPETDTQALHGAGEQTTDAASDAAAGSEAMYSLRDFLRAQIERRWNIDLSVLGERRIVVALRVVMKRNGAITTAEIVDKTRYASDKQFRQVAISARNAILLASPIALPAGDYPAETEMTLKLDPRDAMR